MLLMVIWATWIRQVVWNITLGVGRSKTKKTNILGNCKMLERSPVAMWFWGFCGSFVPHLVGKYIIPGDPNRSPNITASQLVCGWTNLFEKHYIVKLDHFPNFRGEHQTYVSCHQPGGVDGSIFNGFSIQRATAPLGSRRWQSSPRLDRKLKSEALTFLRKKRNI